MKIELKRLKEGDNPRVKLFDSEEEKERMKAGMQHYDLHFQPLEVYPLEDGYHEIDQGHRRFACAKEMSWTEIECRVLPALLPERERFLKRINEDDNTRLYSPYEKMLTMEKLKEKFKFSQKRIAKEFRRSEAWISYNLTIVKIPELKIYLENGGDFNKAKHLSQINERDRIAILGSLDNYTTAQLERIVSDAKHIEVIKPPLESPTEALESIESHPCSLCGGDMGFDQNTESYFCSCQEESRIADEVVKLEGHASEDSSAVHPIYTSGESEDDGDTQEPKISPDGELEEDQTQPEGDAIPPSESSPSKPDYPKQVWMCMCGSYRDSKKALKKEHECGTNGYQQYLNRVNRDFARACVPSQKNGREFWMPQHSFVEMAKKPGSIIYIENEIKKSKEILKNVENAFENARNKIEAS